MSAAVPRIVIPAAPQPPAALPASDDPLLGLIDLLRAPDRNAAALNLARALIVEGRSFAQTPSGQRWASLLARSSLVENGWLLWNRANLDLYLQGGDAAADTPALMLEEVMRRLVSGDLEHYVTVLGALLAEEAMGRPLAEER
jgi:hypothetical protein